MMDKQVQPKENQLKLTNTTVGFLQQQKITLPPPTPPRPLQQNAENANLTSNH